MLISIPIPHISWISNRRKRNLLQHIFTDSKLKQKEVTSQMMLPLLRIFIKGLKNAHRLATCIYEKGPQTLMDAILEVEKLNATQQLTAMIMLSSIVNVISNEEGCCFQCQEPGYIALETALTLGVMSPMTNTVTLPWTAHTEYLLQELQQHITNHTRVIMPDQV